MDPDRLSTLKILTPDLDRQMGFNLISIRTLMEHLTLILVLLHLNPIRSQALLQINTQLLYLNLQNLTEVFPTLTIDHHLKLTILTPE